MSAYYRSTNQLSAHRLQLIQQVWKWDRMAIERGSPVEIRRNIWRVLDALYEDQAIVQTPGYRRELRGILERMKQTSTVKAVRLELGLEDPQLFEKESTPAQPAET